MKKFLIIISLISFLVLPVFAQEQQVENNNDTTEFGMIYEPETKKEQIEMIDKLNEEIGSLKRQIHEIQIKNMKDFESLLTAKQKKTLDKIKMESRRDFQKHHKPGNRPCPPPPPLN